MNWDYEDPILHHTQFSDIQYLEVRLPVNDYFQKIVSKFNPLTTLIIVKMISLT